MAKAIQAKRVRKLMRWQKISESVWMHLPPDVKGRIDRHQVDALCYHAAATFDGLERIVDAVLAGVAFVLEEAARPVSAETIRINIRVLERRLDDLRCELRQATHKPIERHAAKIDMALADQIRHRFNAGETQASIADDYGVTQQTVSLVVRSKTWRPEPVVMIPAV